VRYRFIRKQEGQFSVSALCRALRVSRSGYTFWRRRPPSRRSQEEQALLGRIRAAHNESRGTYGSPRITQELRAREVSCSRNRVARLMRKDAITARPVRRFVVTTDSRHALPVAANHLEQKFTAEQPNTHWSADITYLWTSEGWLYLAVVVDLYSRRVVGWSIRDTLDRSIVLSALESALVQRHPGAGLVCHSDRGSQYASADYQEVLSGAGAVCSMSRKGNCYDNAPVESFFASLKRELIHRCPFATREEARSAVFEWIAVWYNRKRRHSSLGYVSPEQFEQQHHPPEMTRRAA
jgi:putative transposase